MTRSIVTFVIALLVLSGLVPMPAVAATNDTITSLTTSGSPFARDMPPLPDALEIQLELARRGKATVTITRPNGTLVKRLAYRVGLAPGTHTWSWDGTNASGLEVRDGEYVVRVVVTNPLGTARARREIRKGLPPIYPANPGAVVIVVDAGHGGRYVGAAYRGVGEETINLAIALYLRDMLERAGVTVVMTRTTDTEVLNPLSDQNGDGLVNQYDDLAMRNDIANEARADINLHVHNNASECRCHRGTSVYTNLERTWTPDALTLAQYLQDAQLGVLDQYRDATYYPEDDGVRPGRFYYMEPYAVACSQARYGDGCKPEYLPRPSLAPSILMESLYVNDDMEWTLLMRDDVRISLAAAMYLGMAEWLNSRRHGIAYEVIDAPATAEAGALVTYRLRITNRGNATSSGWRLRLGAVPAVPLYDGSGAPGTKLGAVAIPDGLAPGASLELDVQAVAPGTAGDWLVKADVVLPGRTFASDAGIVSLQLPLTTTIAP